MAEFSANAVQTVNPGESVIFTSAEIPCPYGFVRHRDESGNFLLSGAIPTGCCRKRTAGYFVDFGANVAIPDGGVVGPINLAITLDGSTLPATSMEVTPAAVEEFFNVSRGTNVQIWAGCCETITVRNVGAQPILVQNANIIINRTDMR